MSDEDNGILRAMREFAATVEKQERARRADEDRRPVLGFCVDVHSAELGNIIQEKLRRLETLEIPQDDHFAKAECVRARSLLSCLLPHLIEGVTYRLSMQEMSALSGPETCETAWITQPRPWPTYRERDQRAIDEIEFQENGSPTLPRQTPQ
jgi:hypothetical protein